LLVRLTRSAFDESRDDPAEKVGRGGGPWAKLRVSLPVVR
jgi:hypothetical protein